MRRRSRQVAEQLQTAGWRFHGSKQYEGMSLADYLFEIGRQVNAHVESLKLVYRDCIGILSLTADPLNAAMWAHYAADHAGFVIHFSGRALLGGLLRGCRQWELGWAWPIIYSDRQHSASTLDIAALAYEKASEWAYEKEWRVVRFLQEATKILDQNIHLFRIEASTMRGVVLGAHVKSELIDYFMTLADRDSRYSHLAVAQVVTDVHGVLRTQTLRQVGGAALPR
jgi:hypothetical protein